MKKIFAVSVLIVLVLFICQNTFADTGENFFAVVKTECEETELNDRWRLIARYKETKKPIALSSYYNGYVYATVPANNKDMQIEAFVPEDVEFADYDESKYEFYNMETLYNMGVIKGNDKGEARPFDNITRAEAAAMILRFFGLEEDSGYTVDFDDVTRDDWFYNSVATAYNYDIVEGVSDKSFLPLKNISREEVTLMFARALKKFGLRCPKSNIDNIKDKDTISPWASEGYEIIGSCYISDYDDTDYENPYRVLLPQKEATRWDMAYMLKNAADLCQLYPSDMAVKFGFDKEMPVIDGSTSTYPFTQAVYTSLFCNGPSHEKFPQKHSKSHTSYQRLINGEVDMLFASVYPASDILKMAEESGVELELIPIAYDAMIFFTNADNPAQNLTKEQITDIYVNNKYDNWSQIGGTDAILYPYCRNNDSGSHAQMERHFLNGSDIHPEVKKETSFTMSNVLTDVMAAKTENPTGYGLGYSIYYYYHNMDMFYDTLTELKLLAIDGVQPTDATIADGTYPLSNNTYVVIRKDTPEDAPARKMAEFMLTPAGQQCVEQAGFGKLK